MKLGAVFGESPIGAFEVLDIREALIQDYLKSLQSNMKHRLRTSLTNDASELPERGSQQGSINRPRIVVADSTRITALWGLERCSDAKTFCEPTKVTTLDEALRLECDLTLHGLRPRVFDDR